MLRQEKVIHVDHSRAQNHCQLPGQCCFAGSGSAVDRDDSDRFLRKFSRFQQYRKRGDKTDTDQPVGGLISFAVMRGMMDRPAPVCFHEFIQFNTFFARQHSELTDVIIKNFSAFSQQNMF